MADKSPGPLGDIQKDKVKNLSGSPSTVTHCLGITRFPALREVAVLMSKCFKRVTKQVTELMENTEIFGMKISFRAE